MTVHFLQTAGGLEEAQVAAILPSIPSLTRKAALQGAQIALRSGDADLARSAQRVQHRFALEAAGDSAAADQVDIPDLQPFIAASYVMKGKQIATHQARESGMLSGDAASDASVSAGLEAGALRLWKSLAGDSETAARMGAAADAGGFAFSRIVNDGPVVREVWTPTNLGTAIPVRNIPPGTDKYTIRYSKVVGQVGPHHAGATTHTNVLPGQPVQSFHGLQFWTTAVVGEDWLGRLQTAQSGYDPLPEQNVLARHLLEQKRDELLKSGGGNIKGLAGMASRRSRESVVFGGSGVTADQIAQAVRSQVREVVRESSGAYTINRVLWDRKTWQDATNYDQYVAGGAVPFSVYLRQIIEGEGVQMLMTDKMDSFRADDSSGNRVDGITYFYDGPFGLKRREAMSVTPVHTYVSQSGATVTIMAIGLGDIHSEHEGACYIVEQPCAQ